MSRDPPESFRGGVTGGLNCGMDSVLVKLFQQFNAKIRPEERFSAGEGHTAAAFLVEGKILQTFFKNLFGRDRAAFLCQRAGRAGRQAGAAMAAAVCVKSDPVFFPGDRAAVTGAYTGPAVTAFALIPEQLRTRQLALRVGAPSAAERTAFKLDSGTDTGAVIDGKFLDIEDSGLLHWVDSFWWGVYSVNLPLHGFLRPGSLYHPVYRIIYQYARIINIRKHITYE